MEICKPKSLNQRFNWSLTPINPQTAFLPEDVMYKPRTEKSIKKPPQGVYKEDSADWHPRKYAAPQCLFFVGICLSLSFTSTAWAACERELDEAVLTWRKNGDQELADGLRRLDEYRTKNGIEIPRNELVEAQKLVEQYKNRAPNNTFAEGNFRQAIFVVCRSQNFSPGAASKLNSLNTPTTQPPSKPLGQNNTPQQNQSTQQQSQQAQQQAQQSRAAQQQSQQAVFNSAQNQTAADQTRKSERRRHEPENEAHDCLSLDKSGLFGGIVNKCDFKVAYQFCNFNPKKDSWAESHTCGKSGGADFVGAGRTSAAHIKNTETVYWFACKDPAWPVDVEYVAGKGIQARCYTIGGK